MLSIISDAMHVATRTEMRQDRAAKRYYARQDKERFEAAKYKQWLETSARFMR